MFRIAINEFKKLFKMPITYVMGILLVASVFLLQLAFNPLEIDNSLNISNNSITETYNLFNTSEYKVLYDSKISNATTTLNYYRAKNERENNISTAYNIYLAAYSTMLHAITPGQSGMLETSYTAFKNALSNLKNACLDFSGFYNIPYVEMLSTSQHYTIAINDLTLLLNKIAQYDIQYTDIATKVNILTTAYNTDDYSEKIFNAVENSKSFLAYTLMQLSNQIENYTKIYIQHMEQSSANFGNGNLANTYRTTLMNSILEYNNLFNEIVDYDYPIVIVEKQLKENLEQQLEQAYATLNISTNTEVRSTHVSIKNSLKQFSYNSLIEKFNTSVYIVKIENLEAENINKIIEKANEEKNDIYSEITEAYASNNNVLMLEEMASYKALSDYATDLVTCSIVLNCIQNVPLSIISKSYKYNSGEYNKYTCQTRITYSTYCIENSVYDNRNLDNFQFNVAVNGETTALDFMVFALRLSAILISIFCIFLATILISGELKTGTLKLTIMCPYNRYKILFGKIIATIFVATIFLVLVSIFSFIVGISNYTIPSGTIVTLFNSKSIIKLSPFFSILVYILTQAVYIAFFILLGFLFSVIFKKPIFALTSSIFTFLVIIFINIINDGGVIFSFLPTLNLDFSKYFIINNLANHSVFLNKLMVTQINLNMNFDFSVTIYLLYFLFLGFITTTLFNKKDY